MAALAVLATGCVTAPPPAFTARTAEDGTVFWKNGLREGKAFVVFETGSGNDVRLRVDSISLEIVRMNGQWIATSGRQRWRGANSAVPPALEGWLNLAEFCGATSALPDGASEVRTGRFSGRYLRRSGRLVTVELVTVAGGERFRLEF